MIKGERIQKRIASLAKESEKEGKGDEDDDNKQDDN